jgi:YVTN family beta-propeller protein
LHKVYVSNQLENTVAVIDSRSHKIVATLKTGEYPENIALDEGNQRLYVLNWFDGTLSVFDSQTDTEINRIDVGDGSRSFGQFVAKTVDCHTQKH